MSRLQAIEPIAERILGETSDPAVRFRLLRDALRRARNDAELAAARDALSKSRWVRQLDREQQSDGGWGRFHSSDTTVRKRIPTTEFGVERGLALGLDASSGIFRKACRYVTAILEGRLDFPDPPEKNERWQTGVRMIAAGTLARINGDAPVLDEVWEVWAQIAQRTFASGRYDGEAEIHAHRELTGAPADLRYLIIGNRYALALLGARADALPCGVATAIVRWLWNRNDGIGYLGAALSTAKFTEAWFAGMELLSCFPGWRDVAAEAVEKLWSCKGDEGLWDFGPRSSGSSYFPLSESWRKKHARQHDWSTRVLALLRAFRDPA